MHQSHLFFTNFSLLKFYTFSYIFILTFISFSSQAQEIYAFPNDVQTGWSSFENANGIRGKGGLENKGAKGHPVEVVLPSQSKSLLDIKGAGRINRIWMTFTDMSPRMLRSLVITMYWDGETKPAVSVPVGDFFGIGLGRTTSFQSALFSSPEGRSFNCNIPMPFRKGAKICITNQSNKPVSLFYDINFFRVTKQDANALYFHAFWNQNYNDTLGEDFTILPKVIGKGRFLGCNLGIITDSIYGKSWWGEGEIKMYLDGDLNHASLVGTGTEDYIGTAFFIKSAFAHLYQGCPIVDTLNKQWAFYRYHIPDPIFFTHNCKVTIQQMGADDRDNVRNLLKAGAKLKPVVVLSNHQYLKLLEKNSSPNLLDSTFPKGLTLFYRLDNYSATAYFYLDKPVNNLPSLPPMERRIQGIDKK